MNINTLIRQSGCEILACARLPSRATAGRLDNFQGALLLVRAWRTLAAGRGAVGGGGVRVPSGAAVARVNVLGGAATARAAARRQGAEPATRTVMRPSQRQSCALSAHRFAPS